MRRRIGEDRIKGQCGRTFLPTDCDRVRVNLIFNAEVNATRTAAVRAAVRRLNADQPDAMMRFVRASDSVPTGRFTGPATPTSTWFTSAEKFPRPDKSS